MTTQDYNNKAQELSNKFNTTITVESTWNNKPCLTLKTFDKANALKEMKVASGFNIGFMPFDSLILV